MMIQCYTPKHIDFLESYGKQVKKLKRHVKDTKVVDGRKIWRNGLETKMHYVSLMIWQQIRPWVRVFYNTNVSRLRKYVDMSHQTMKPYYCSGQSQPYLATLAKVPFYVKIDEP